MAAVEATEVAESAQTFEARVAATEQVMRRAYDNSLLVEPALPLSPVHRSRSPQPSPRRLDAMHEAAEAAFEAADLAGLDSAILSIQLGEAAAAAKAAEAAEATEGAYETAKSYARRSLESSARCQRGVDDGVDDGDEAATAEDAEDAEIRKGFEMAVSRVADRAIVAFHLVEDMAIQLDR